MMKHDLEQLANALIPLAEEVSKVIMGFYKTPLNVEAKDDGSPVTEADQASHDLLMAGLQALLPQVPVISEEGDLSLGFNQAQEEYFWLVDPLDGTKGFIRQNDEFTINIALMHQGEPILGLIHHPPTEQTFWGYADVAFEKRGGQVEAIRCGGKTEGPFRVLMGRHCDDTYALQMRAILDRYPIVSRTHFGSALKFCFLAKGEFDLYVRFAPSGEWDVAAGHAIVKGAGGRLTTLEGTPFLYGKEGFLNPGFIVFGHE